jgi:2-hydroxychromene-2-carboxylate isomerase
MVETPEQTQKPVDGLPTPQTPKAKPSTDNSALMRLSGVALIFLAIGLAAGFFIPGLIGYNPQGQTTENVDQTFLSQNITAYLNDNFLTVQGLNAEISDFTDFTDDLYVVDFEIKEGENVLQAGQLYASKDGSAIVLGEVLKLDEPLPIAEPPAPPEPQEFAKSDKPKVELFVMSYCPFGQQAETNFYSVVDLLGESVDIEPHFIHYENYCGYGVKCKVTEEERQMGYTEAPEKKAEFCLDADEEVPQYCAMHGVDELYENMRQMCVLQDHPDKFWNYVKRINQDLQDDTDYCNLGDNDCWQAAMEAEGIDVASIEACVTAKTDDFVASEKALMEERGVSGSPTVVINGLAYNGLRDSESFKNAICSAFNDIPAACSEELDASTTAASAACGA